MARKRPVFFRTLHSLLKSRCMQEEGKRGVQEAALLEIGGKRNPRFLSVVSSCLLNFAKKQDEQLIAKHQ